MLCEGSPMKINGVGNIIQLMEWEVLLRLMEQEVYLQMLSTNNSNRCGILMANDVVVMM